MWNRLLRRLPEPWWPYIQLMRLDKPIGIYLLLWPTLWGLWIAGEGQPRWLLVLVFVLGVVLMRSAGCVVNDMLDARFDRHVARTCERPLAAGVLRRKQAFLTLLAVLALAASLLLFLNRPALLLVPVALFMAMTYPLMKRYTYLPQVYLGAAFGLGIPMAFAAQTGEIPPLAWLLFAANILWVVAYDTEYAMVDREDDLKIGVKSTAILFDDLDRHAIGLLQLLFLWAMWLVGSQAHLGLPYRVSLGLAALLFLWQQWLIHQREPQRCFRAFLNNHWVGLVVFAGIVLDYMGRL